MIDKIKQALDAIAQLTPKEKQIFLSKLFINRNPKVTSPLNMSVGKNRFRNGISCPHCKSVKTVRNGKVNNRQHYRCMECGKAFSDTTKTVAFKSKYHYDTWLLYMECMQLGLSIKTSAERCGISKATSFYWRHKILASLENIEDKIAPLKGVVEADETFFLTSYKGNHSQDGFVMPRPPKKRGTPAKKRGLSNEQICVPCAISRDNGVMARISGTGKVSLGKIKYAFSGKIEDGTVLVTDKERAYIKFAEESKLSLIRIKADNHIYKGIYHIQHINAFHSRLKGFMRGFNGISTKHLNNYLAWFIWIWTHRDIKDVRFVNNSLIESLSNDFVCTIRDIRKKPELPWVA